MKWIFLLLISKSSIQFRILQKFDICEGRRCQKYMKEILHYNITYSMHWDSLVNVPLYINCLKEKFSVRWSIFSQFLPQSLLVKTKCSCYILGNLWTPSNKSFTRAALIHFYLKTCSLFCWPRLSYSYISFLTISYNAGVDTLVVGVNPLYLMHMGVSVTSALKYYIEFVNNSQFWLLGFNLIMLMLSGFTIWPD